MRALQRYLPAAARGDDVGVHQARVASRRLREAVPVLTSGVKSNKADKARGKIRRLTRALGTVRELDVTLHVLDELARKSEMPRGALEDVRAHVVTERDHRRELMLKRLEDVNTEKLARRLRSVAATLAETDPTAWREALALRVAKRSKRFAAAIHEAGHMYAPDRLHQVRIAAKKLRYALELAAESGTQSAKPMLNLLKRVQDTLGRLNDFQVLLQHVAAVEADPPARRGATDGGLSIVARALEDQCRHLHAQYLHDAPALGAAAESCRTTVAPQLLHPVRRGSTTLKMTIPGPARVPARRA
jgi:CHAD domain-containing protein